MFEEDGGRCSPLTGGPEVAPVGLCHPIPGRILEPECLKDLATSTNASVPLRHLKPKSLQPENL